ncbi:unnamed protein product [Spirodela intermedia]|uniref:RING-type E3 ubiquitin transferase n=2 Tax=Spirodela intermedia TaxID=51605 RepID=A0A7I8IKD1_SPIIN|nr:unnamed protein product [Spirodela intermedia]CAA6658342.1 unnamed protein product [Spirodela intermedia]CAA7394563.1 unnamed protein product [Spirodela intermedia]
MEMDYPDDFRCPISLEVMTDPVILSSGHTFDRASIQRWLDSGNQTCPVTKMLLPRQPSLIPNHALRSLISTFVGPTGGTKHVKQSNRRGSSPAADPDALLASLTFPADARSLDRVRDLAKESPYFRDLVLESGAASSVVIRHAGFADWPELQETALMIVLELSLHGDDAKVGLVADGVVDRLVTALRNGTPGCQALAATTLTSLAMLQVNKCTIGAHPSAIAELVEVLRNGKGRERREAATALYVLCSFPENRLRVVRSGAAPVLVELAGYGVERAIEVLELLGKYRGGREEMERVDGLVRVLASVLRKGSARGVGDALLLLNLLCTHSTKMRSETIEEGVLDICQGLVEGSGKIAKNACMLMDTLQDRAWD